MQHSSPLLVQLLKAPPDDLGAADILYFSQVVYDIEEGLLCVNCCFQLLYVLLEHPFNLFDH